MGADRALHVEVSGSEYEGLLPLGVAKILAAIVQKEEANLVMLGKQVSRRCVIHNPVYTSTWFPCIHKYRNSTSMCMNILYTVFC